MIVKTETRVVLCDVCRRTMFSSCNLVKTADRLFRKGDLVNAFDYMKSKGIDLNKTHHFCEQCKIVGERLLDVIGLGNIFWVKRRVYHLSNGSDMRMYETSPGPWYHESCMYFVRRMR